MSINTSPPSAQVSMADLMSLPPQQLAAMANNQQPSIAPPWMVTSALNAVNQMKAGQQQPQQPGTIKSQVVQQAMAQQHPMAQGIGAIPAPVPGQQQLPASQPPTPQQQPQQAPPQQGMAAGGSVRHFDSGGSTNDPTLGQLMSNTVLPWLKGYNPSQPIVNITPAASAPFETTGTGGNYGGTHPTTPTAKPTAATKPANTSSAAFTYGTPEFNAMFVNDTNNGAQFGGDAMSRLAGAGLPTSNTASELPASTSVLERNAATSGVPPAPDTGVPAAGANPLSKYLGRPAGPPTNDVQMPDINDTPDLTPPTPTHLNEALAYYQDPDGAAARSVRGAGLAAYAAQMNPTHLSVGDVTGFGGRSAASDAAQFAAQQARADYIQGKAEQYGTAADTLAAQNYAANVTHKEEQQKENLQNVQYNNTQANQTYQTQVNAAVQAEHNRIMEQSNQLLMQMRQDQNTLGFATLYTNKATQVDQESQAYADSVIKNDATGAYTDPAARTIAWRNAYNAHHGAAMQSVNDSFSNLMGAARSSGNANRPAAAGMGSTPPAPAAGNQSGIGAYSGVTGQAGVLKVPGYN